MAWHYLYEARATDHGAARLAAQERGAQDAQAARAEANYYATLEEPRMAA